ncbi:MAG: AAA-like domain-containing protein [Deltaproteobacteria bacterium]|jgi:hypothetical protein|nr:AAA-like domain-containing protein [Deltaproteobacteria bacterium]
MGESKERRFNTLGPVDPSRHFCIPVTERIPGIVERIESDSFLILDGHSLTGKTSALLSLRDEIQKRGNLNALYVSLEVLDGIAERDEATRIIAECLDTSLSMSGDKELSDFKIDVDGKNPSLRVYAALTQLKKASKLPLAILFDKCQALSFEILVSFLHQIRDGVEQGTGNFPSSIVLTSLKTPGCVSMETKGEEPRDREAILFKLPAEKIELKNFSSSEIEELFRQHTDLTGVKYEKSALDEILYFTDGHPYLVSAIGQELTESLKDSSTLVTRAEVDQAVANIKKKPELYLESLFRHLKEARVRKVMESVILGLPSLPEDVTDEDLSFVKEQGLLSVKDSSLAPANPIFRDEMMVYLTKLLILGLPKDLEHRFATDTLDMNAILKSFQHFVKEQSLRIMSPYGYHRAGMYLLLQAYLQKIVGHKGEIIREYALGRQRMDLLVLWNKASFPLTLELKGSQETLKESLRSMVVYMERFKTKESWLLVHDEGPTTDWEKKLFFHSEKGKNDLTINVVGI